MIDAALLNNPVELQKLVEFMTPDEREQFTKLQASILDAHAPIWAPMPGPQTLAVQSEADVLWVGGGAGSGKSNFIVGMSLTKFSRSIIFRKRCHP